MLRLKSPYRDGTTHIVMQPQDFMQRLAALVPRPRLHLIRFHGVLAPNAKLRAAVIPKPAQKDSAPAHEHAHGQAARMSWTRLLKRVFDIDVERCVCGGQLRITLPPIQVVPTRSAGAGRRTEPGTRGFLL